MTEQTHSHNSLGHHVAGLVICLILTAVPFGVYLWAGLPHGELMVIVGFAGVAQLLVQMHFFLGIGFSSMRQDRGVSLVFAIVLLVIMIGGTLWIMSDLGRRMMG